MYDGGIDKYRDPVHGFIEVRLLENAIINSVPFQRLSNIKQLAMTNMVYYGAEHTRFGHSIGVMYLVSKIFGSITKLSGFLCPVKRDWYEQILRLIALTHDLGHAHFSHASEAVFSRGMTRESVTEKIVKNTVISDTIAQIGQSYREKYGPDYAITPDLICDIYNMRLPG